MARKEQKLRIATFSEMDLLFLNGIPCWYDGSDLKVFKKGERKTFTRREDFLCDFRDILEKNK